MSVTKTLVKSCNGANNQTLDGTYTLICDEEINFSEAVPIGTNTNYVLGSILAAKVQSLFIIAQANCTIDFNATSSPPLAITLTAGIPYEWDIDCGFANPLPTTWTSIYVTCAALCQLDIAIGLVV